MSEFNVGVIRPVRKGAYSNTLAYDILNIVSQGGIEYQAVKDNSAGTSLADVGAWVQITGSTGAVGAVGNTGAVGATGNTGATGAKGDTGNTGAIGAVGSTGATGITGAVGAVGQGFIIGATFNSVALLQAGSVAEGEFGLVAGTLSQDHADYGKLYLREGGNWTYITDMSIKGAAGIQGATGATGAVGATGNTGATGAKGDTGNTGAVGAVGAKGDKGDTGDAVTALNIDADGHLIVTVG